MLMLSDTQNPRFNPLGPLTITTLHFSIGPYVLITARPLLCLLASLRLFDNSHFIPQTNQSVDVFLHAFLWKSNVQSFYFMHENQIQNSLTYDGIVVEDLVELAQLKKQNLVIHLRFDVPILAHRLCEFTEFVRWNVNCRRIILLMSHGASFVILNVFRL